MNLSRIKAMHCDNVLIRMSHHEKREELSNGGIIVPQTAREPGMAEAVIATVIMVGPGYNPGMHCDTCGKAMDRCRECGSQSTLFSTVFIEAPVKAGDVVLVSGPHGGDRIYDDHDVEHRIVRFEQIMAVLED